jgi:hypothetical protein
MERIIVHVPIVIARVAKTMSKDVMYVNRIMFLLLKKDAYFNVFSHSPIL